jgi:hypothetical protein
MTTSATPMSSASKVVVACLDGERRKGYVFNFSALRDSFHLFPEPNSPQSAAKDLQLRDVKAIFFVKEFAGNRERQDSHELEEGAHGRKLEVTFHDGEKVPGTTEAYNPKKLGFFMFPADPESNNTRIFVINANVSKVKLL